MESILSLGSAFFQSALPFLVVLGIVIFIHELGHFLVGRACGARVDVFSVGFGPTLWSRPDRCGTLWRVALFPLGGYVKFYGDDDPASFRRDSTLDSLPGSDKTSIFSYMPIWKRSLTILAGPVANFILAFFIFTAVFSLQGRPLWEPRITQIQANSAADRAGLQPGDLIVAINQVPIKSFKEVQAHVQASQGGPIQLDLVREGASLSVTLTPDPVGEETPPRQWRLGVRSDRSVDSTAYMPLGIFESAQESLLTIGRIITGTFYFLGQLLHGAGQDASSQITGPLGIAQASGHVASLGLMAFLNFIALISVSIGIVNLLPIPLLDGGHLVFHLLEAVRGRTVGARFEAISAGVGAFVLISVMIWATWNDLLRLFNWG